MKSKSIASELVPLGVLFVTSQSTDVAALSFSAVTLAAMVMILPPIFRVFDRFIAPFAPKTEFTFLVIVALLCAFITRELGVYYLVGAFVVGLTAVRMRKNLPALSSEKLLGAVELFASFFIPFYFLKSGLHLRAEQFTWDSLLIAAVLLAVVLPIRDARVALHRPEGALEGGRPNRDGGAAHPRLHHRHRRDSSGALRAVDHALRALFIFTLVPGFVLRTPPPEFDTPEFPRETGHDAGQSQPRNA